MSKYTLFIATLIITIGAAGLYKLPNSQKKAHALGVITTTGWFMAILALILQLGDAIPLWKWSIIILFQLVTSPLSSHLFAKVYLSKKN